jgi:hypothetical protein
MIIQLIDEAVENGARREQATALLGLSARTVARWRTEGGGDDRRQGPKAPPAHKLTPEERAQVVGERPNPSKFEQPTRGKASGLFGLAGAQSDQSGSAGSAGWGSTGAFLRERRAFA